jgi:hypothetical protein
LTRRGTAPVAGIAATTPDGSKAQATATAIARARLLDPVPSELADFTVNAAAYVAAGKALANAAAALVSTLNRSIRETPQPFSSTSPPIRAAIITYYVERDVHMPARLPYAGDEIILDVLHFVDGLLPTADRSKIRLSPSYPTGSRMWMRPVEYEEITMGADSSTNYSILPGDRLVDPQAQGAPRRKLPLRANRNNEATRVARRRRMLNSLA